NSRSHRDQWGVAILSGATQPRSCGDGPVVLWAASRNGLLRRRALCLGWHRGGPRGLEASQRLGVLNGRESAVAFPPAQASISYAVFCLKKKTAIRPRKPWRE